MKQLYIIGNGFDIHHGLPSRYSNYLDWLKENDLDLIERLRNYYDVDDKEWWNQFEIELGHPNMTEYIDETAFENQPDFGSDDFRDRDYHTGQFIAEDEIGSLVANIKETFSDWVESLQVPHSNKKIILNKNEAFFINFNYTDTLQKLYNIKPADILFIHGNVSSGTDLIFGHNRSYEELDNEFAPELPKPPDDLDSEDLAEWYEVDGNSGEDYIHQSVRGEVVSQIYRLKKNTENIINENKKIFDALKDVQNVYIYGWSFSLVDLPYLNEVLSKVNKATTEWVVSFHSEEDKETAKRYFSQKGIDNTLVSYIKLSDLLLIKQGEIQFDN